MTREEAIDVLRYLDDQCIWQEDCIQVGGCNHCKEAINMAIEALSADTVKVAYICDGRKCEGDCSDCFRTLDIEHARDFKLMGDTYFQQVTDITTYCDVIAECEDCPIYGQTCCGERKENGKDRC